MYPQQVPLHQPAGEGFLAYDTAGDQVLVYDGTSWGQVGSGDITGVTAGAGITGGGTSGTVTLNVIGGDGLSVAADQVDLDVSTSGTTSTTSANSGLETAADGLSLLRGCSDNQVLKWDAGSGVWQCENDTGGGGALDVEEGDSLVASAASTIDFLAADFIVTESPAGEANVAIDYAGSGVARVGEAETVTGGWTFNTADTTFTSAVDINSASTVAGLTIDSDASFIATGGFTLGDGGETGSINTSDWDISTTGALTGVSFDANGPGNSISNIDNADLTNSSVTVTAGTGLSGGGLVSLGGAITLNSILGTSIENAELSADTIDFDRIADTLTLDAETTVSAASALNYLIGNNVALTATGTGTITATDVAANAVTLGTDTSGNYVATIADAGNGTVTVTDSGSETAGVTLDVVDVNCTDCFNATEIEDIYLLNTGDTLAGTFDGGVYLQWKYHR